MRTSSRSLASSCRSTPVLGRGRLSAAAIALGLLASTSAAYAQPAAPQPAQPPAGQPPAGQPPAGQPAAGQPAAGQAAPGAAAPAGSPDARPQDEPLVPPPAATPPAAGGTTAPAAGTTTVASPDPDRDQRALSRQGAERPAPTGDVGQRPSEVFSEDWWSQARPSFELHGLFRVRAELFHHFALGRRDPVGSALWPQPPDNSYVPTSGTRQLVRLCGDNPLNTSNCENNTQAGANMRFRLTPELHISDNLRVMSQIDIFDNVVLGSTPEGYANQPGANGYAVVAPGGYAPLGAFAQTAWAPVGGQTSLTDSIVVKRVWGEYATPVGLLRFGRMPNQWGLGILNNEGNGYDSDWQSTVDRIMFVTGIPKYDLYFTGAWDFIHEGPLSASQQQQQGQPYDLGQLDDVSQYVLMAARRRDPELARLDLAKGLPVINGGVYFAYRNQVIANDSIDATNGAAFGRTSEDVRLGYTRRCAQFFTPDVWFQFLYKKFRFEAEAAMVYGSLENTRTTGQPEPNTENPAAEPSRFDDDVVGWKVQQFGLATQAEFRTLEDKLRLDFGFGWASGDPDVASLQAPRTGMERQLTADRTYSTFRFHPDYRIDLILWRNVMQRVQGAYYLRPSVQYDFSRDPNGQRLGGSAAVIWSRASEFIQAPGHKRDLGIELNFALYFQAKDGTLNDGLDKMGGFYTSLQYGVLFPLGGLGYLPQQISRYQNENGGAQLDTETAQVLRWYLGIMF